MTDGSMHKMALTPDDQTTPMQINCRLTVKFRHLTYSHNRNQENINTVASDGVIISTPHDQYPVKDEEKRETYRLASFRTYRGPLEPLRLTMAGFCYTGDGDRVLCFSCRVVIEDFNEQDNPSAMIWHKKDCKFMLGLDSGNIALGSRRQASSTEAVALLQPKRDLPIQIAGTVGAEHRKILLSLNLFKEVDRRRSFTLFWSLHIDTRFTSALAKKGFFYLGDDDRTECFSCHVVLRRWQVNDDIDQTHADARPTCRMLRHEEARNIPISADGEESNVRKLELSARRWDEASQQASFATYSTQTKRATPSDIQVQMSLQASIAGPSGLQPRYVPTRLKNALSPTPITSYPHPAPALPLHTSMATFGEDNPPLNLDKERMTGGYNVMGIASSSGLQANRSYTPEGFGPATHVDPYRSKSSLSQSASALGSVEISELSLGEFLAKKSNLEAAGVPKRDVPEAKEHVPAKLASRGADAKEEFNGSSARYMSSRRAASRHAASHSVESPQRQKPARALPFHPDAPGTAVRRISPVVASSTSSLPAALLHRSSRSSVPVDAMRRLSATSLPRSEEAPAVGEPGHTFQTPDPAVGLVRPSAFRPYYPPSLDEPDPLQDPLLAQASAIERRWQPERPPVVSSPHGVSQPYSPVLPPGSQFRPSSNSPHPSSSNVGSAPLAFSTTAAIPEPTGRATEDPPSFRAEETRPRRKKEFLSRSSRPRRTSDSEPPLSPSSAASIRIIGEPATRASPEPDDSFLANLDPLSGALPSPSPPSITESIEFDDYVMEPERTLLREEFPCEQPGVKDKILLQSRLDSFDVTFPQYESKSTITDIAKAGFYHLKKGDLVRCFYCGQTTMGWSRRRQVWQQHAVISPRCPYLLRSRGLRFVEEVRSDPSLMDASDDEPEVLVGETADPVPSITGDEYKELLREALSSEIVRQLLAFDYDRDTIKKLIRERVKKCSRNYGTINEALDDLDDFQPDMIDFGSTSSNDDSIDIPLPSPVPEFDVHEIEPTPSIGRSSSSEMRPPSRSSGHGEMQQMRVELNRLREERRCKVCLDRDSEVVFQPCNHLCACLQCTSSLRRCPVCREWIERYHRTYQS